MSEYIRSKILCFNTQYKTNGCAEMSEPDKKDWIITCEEQAVVYLLVMETIESVRSLMEQSQD